MSATDDREHTERVRMTARLASSIVASELRRIAAWLRSPSVSRDEAVDIGRAMENLADEYEATTAGQMVTVPRAVLDQVLQALGADAAASLRRAAREAVQAFVNPQP